MTSYEFEVCAKNAIIAAIGKHYGEQYSIHDIHMTMFSHVLGNKKCLAIDSGFNNRYYEVTYNAREGEMYVDIYEKKHNDVVQGQNFDFTVHD